MWARSLGQEGPLQEEMVVHFSTGETVAWRIPWTEEPGGRQSVDLQRVRHDGCDLACTYTS